MGDLQLQDEALRFRTGVLQSIAIGFAQYQRKKTDGK